MLFKKKRRATLPPARVLCHNNPETIISVAQAAPGYSASNRRNEIGFSIVSLFR
jgi:hypothetical protein